MSLKSIILSITNRLDKTVLSDSLYNEKKSRAIKRIKSLEKNILSQGESSFSNYTKLSEALCAKEIYISNKAIKDSVRSRIRNNEKFYPIDKLLTSKLDNGFDLFTFIELNNQAHIEDSLYAQLYIEFLHLVKEVEADLKNKQIIGFLIDLKLKTNRVLKTLIQIPVIASFLEFFDQVFTLKDYEILYSKLHNAFNINVKTNNYHNEQSIYGFIPIINRS